MKSSLTTTPRRFAVLPLAKRPATGSGAVRRYLIVPASKTPTAGVRAP
ncbi:MAG: hypothetical protein QOI80_3603 [Solirubrobacteraceae bacterium]|jgi:hypothetical protein|nr:hypothetical protein [Solirubrobacteraceae bacterium]